MKDSTQGRKERARKHLKKIKQLMAQKPSLFEGMTEEEIIATLRKTRERLWEKKLAIHARHK